MVVVQSLSHVQLFVTPWTAARQASLSSTISLSLLKLMSIDSDAIQPSHSLSPPGCVGVIVGRTIPGQRRREERQEMHKS